jgi:ammonium transporter Rh
MYMDVHVMIFIGFGFLMVFLKSYSWSAVGINLLIAAWSLEFCVLTGVFWDNIGEFYIERNMEGHTNHFKKFEVNLENLIFLAEFGSGAVLITFGGLLGKCNVFQLWTIATIEVIFYSLNDMIVVGILGCVDIGGAMVIHMFGAYFGLACTFFFQPKKGKIDVAGQNGGSYYSNLFAMIGTYFLFLYWPSFNGAVGVGS